MLDRPLEDLLSGGPETGLLPHADPGVMTRDDLADRVDASFGAPPLAEPVDTARLRRPERLVRPDLAVA